MESPHVFCGGGQFVAQGGWSDRENRINHIEREYLYRIRRHGMLPGAYTRKKYFPDFLMPMQFLHIFFLLPGKLRAREVGAGKRLVFRSAESSDEPAPDFISEQNQPFTPACDLGAFPWEEKHTFVCRFVTFCTSIVPVKQLFNTHE